MKRTYIPALMLISCIGSAAAVDLTAGDSAYLDRQFGVKPESPVVKSMTPDERTTLHEIILEPLTKDYPGIRDARVQSFLFNAYNRQCGEWVRAHGSPQCPPATNALHQAGKDIADGQCNACHLYGTAEAPAFFAMARDGKVNEARLGTALASGHRMSPITLSADQLHNLLIYIQGLK